MTENTILTSSQHKQQEYDTQLQLRHQQNWQQQQQQQLQQRPQAYNNNSILISQNRSRRRLKDLNDIITCSICNGYLIEATTINDCGHTFCRSCIVKHLERQKSCPKCGTNSKQIFHSNLRPDNALKALVYKLVPGLYQSECQRVIKFNTDNNIINIDNNLLIPNNKNDNFETTTATTTTTTATTEATAEQEQKYDFDLEANFFSPDEPISLSLEYHPLSIIESGIACTPPIRYLHCPAGVTVQHLCRLIASKYDLNINKNVKIEIIYDGEILKSTFSLMDVAYCFNWTRVSPMRFFYRIFMYPTTTNSNGSNSHNHNNAKVKENPLASLVTHSLSRVENVTHENALQTSKSDNKLNVDDVLTSDVKATKYSDERRFALKPSRKSIYEAKPQSPESSNGTSNENSLKLTLVAKKPDPRSKYDSSKVKQYKPASDFKRLRSDRPCDTVADNSSRNSRESSGGSNKTAGVAKNVYASSTKGSADPANRKIDLYNIDEDNDFFPKGNGKKPSENNNRKNEYKIKRETLSTNDDLRQQQQQQQHQQKSINDTNSLSEKLQKALNHHSSTASAEMNNTKSQNNLKFKYETISKKCYVNVKKHVFAGNVNPQQNQSTVDQTTTVKNRNLDIPKLKIDLKNETSLKTKISVPKQEKRSPNDEVKSPSFNSASSSPSSGSSSSSSSLVTPSRKVTFQFDDPSLLVDKNEYAMNIGLKPVSVDREDVGSSSSHKKRKKAKHSKEPGSKRRKLHAEISSDQNDESLKLKVKITGKPHKHERKSSSGDAPPPPKKEKLEELAQKIDIDIVEKKPNVDAVIDLEADIKEKDQLQELRAVRHKPMVIIPNLNRSLSEGSSTITNLIKNIQNKAEANRNATKKEAALATPAIPSFSFAAKKFPNSSSALQVPQKAPSPHVFKTPSSLTPPPPKVSSPNIMDSSQRLTNNSLQNRVFSPRHTPSYPSFNFATKSPAPATQHQPRLSPISAPGSGMQIYRSNNVPLKRSTSIDSPPYLMAKQPHLNMMEINAQNRLINKPVFPPLKLPISIAKQPATISPKITPPTFPFLGSVTRKLATNSPVVAKPVMNPAAKSSNEFCFKSAIGTSSYTTQESVSNKPLPILLPPSSISVTKMTDISQQLTPAGPIDNRPALEIVAIPPTASVVDQQQKKQQPVAPVIGAAPVKPIIPKTTRPPPPTIPLVKIKRSLTLPLTSPMANNSPPILSPSGDKPKNGVDGNAPLDLSGKSTRSPTHESSDAKPTDNGHSSEKAAEGGEAKKVEEVVTKKSTIPNLTAFKPTSYTTTTPGTRQPIPKLNEINKSKLPPVRQQNPSVRNIPNPSALAFRNQMQQPSSTSSEPTSSASQVTISTSTNATAAVKSSLSSSPPTVSSSTSTTISSTTTTTTSSTKVTSTAPPPTVVNAGTSNNNNNLKTSLQKSNEAQQQLVAKKNLNIEQVAAGLRAKSSSANSSVNVV